ncbi:hypothetical protein [Chitinimonas koreensis]|uniref:hypothetical protein n=1 Tax=Chitinimonas koreensis TaxID=356302 RepID=UPI0004204A25|nr:hypothetical protein [Chitinimonas koreensis]QNM96591.1 hypothetical protein H9L41_23020 [Chitinimonas koreensis]
MDETRRTLILAAGAAALLPAAALADGAPALDPVPPLPTRPTPGKPGDFDFLAGEWKIRHWRLPPGAQQWDRFDGEATCWTILGGVGSVEELRIPARNFSGMGLRLLDVEKRQWSDFWVNAKSGVLAPPGLNGSFEDGAGLFWAEEEEAGRKTLSIGIWDRITPRSCRWRQAVSEDGGRNWAHNWVMEWQRAA